MTAATLVSITAHVTPDTLLLIAGLVAIVWLARRVTILERMVAELHRGAFDPQPVPAVEQEPPAEVESAAFPEETAATAPPPRPTRTRPGFEVIAGGRLPIWIGGAALVVAGFFLVRYSIESGLIGPAARVVLAALFSIVLIAGSEVARRLPATRDDPRVGQVLAGAGTASAYGTLYVAAALYHLIGPVGGFLLMIAITAGALFLALRHGPPTAIMALIGGFAAPLVAGFDAAGVGALLVYLALFITALFALAARRGWSWLALAALVAGFGWANLLLVLLEGRDTAGVAGFVVALAIGATLALPRTGTQPDRLRAAPMIAGLAQLLVLAPTLDFGATAWTFHLILAAAALFLAWRDERLLPAAVAAALLVVALLGAAFLVPERSATPVAAIVATALFGGVGFALSRTSRSWSVVALVGLAGPVLVAHAVAPTLAPKMLWSVAELALAAAAAALAWRHRDRIAQRDIGLVGGATVAAALMSVAIASLAGWAWAPAALIPALLALGWIARSGRDPDLARLPAVVLATAFALALEPIAQLAIAAASSLGGNSLPYSLLPDVWLTLRVIALPAAAGAALLRLSVVYGSWRSRTATALAVAGVAVAYVLAKQPLAIVTPVAFIASGFVERTAITLIIAAVGWGLARRTAAVRTGQLLLALAIARFVWFDVLLFSPILLPQQVGQIPLANAAVLLPALLAAAAATIAPSRGWRIAALLLTAAAVAAAVRQGAHGTLLVGPLGSGETWGYSAAFLLLAVAWLWRGIAGERRDLRIAGLLVLTGVTLKVFLIDVAALGGLLRIVSFLGLGVALIAIGWAYGRIIARPAPAAQPSP
jgi:uncharacterized membrane protein